jgi:hypothetical protein
MGQACKYIRNKLKKIEAKVKHDVYTTYARYGDCNIQSKNELPPSP